MLSGFSGDIGVHGAFYDLTSASLDPAILEITRLRYRQNLRIASELGARYVLFHLNYLGFCKIPNYRPGWHERQVAFWSSFAAEAEKAGVPVLIENSWEDEPSLIVDILSEVNSPNLRACLDIAHATLYSSVPIEEWIEALEPYLFCSHLNNHNGQYDMHWPLTRGIVDYSDVISSLRNTSKPPYLCLEMPRWSFMKPSLSYFELSPALKGDPAVAY
jgi:sugar phosphate isomerase/epimerase